MKKALVIILTSLFLWGGSQASATVIGLFDYGFNIDGSVSFPTMGDPVPGEADISGFDDITGLGNITVDITGAGSHYVGLFVDHEIDEATNTFFNENGQAVGTPGANQTWEIDEPEFVFGDIFSNFQAGSLDNSNNVPAGWEDDVSMAIAYSFDLLSDDFKATIAFNIGQSAPASGFYLEQRDPDSGASIYFGSEFSVVSLNDPPDPVPEPASMLLLGTGLAGLCGIGRKKLLKK